MSDAVQAQPVSRRERLKREREVRILDAAAAVFARKGFHQATIRDIAELADVADGTIYNYFDNKLDLLVAIMARIAELEQLPGELLEALHGDVRDFFVMAFQERMGRIEQGQEMLQAVLRRCLSTLICASNSTSSTCCAFRCYLSGICERRSSWDISGRSTCP